MNLLEDIFQGMGDIFDLSLADITPEDVGYHPRQTNKDVNIPPDQAILNGWRTVGDTLYSVLNYMDPK